MSYDSKYRQRALEYWEEGHTKKETAEVFKVSTYALQVWKSQLKNTGKLEAKKRKETWRKIEPGRLREYVKEHPDAYLREIAEVFGCSDTAIIYALRRLKISRKKTTLYREADESFQQSFLKVLKTIHPSHLVYVD